MAWTCSLTRHTAALCGPVQPARLQAEADVGYGLRLCGLSLLLPTSAGRGGLQCRCLKPIWSLPAHTQTERCPVCSHKLSAVLSAHPD